MKRVLKSLFGRVWGIADDDRVMTTKGILCGDYGQQFAQPDLSRYVIFDDFDGATLLGTWGVAKGTDGAASNFAINGGISGTIQGTTGATTATMAGSGIQISGHLNMKGQGAGGAGVPNDLEFAARVQLNAIANVSIFVGLTNQVAALQAPIIGSGAGNGLTGNANDCVGVLFDTAMTTKDWWLVGNKAGVLAAAQDVGSGPTANVYDQFSISVDQLGNVTFFRNGLQVGNTMANAITPTVGLSPVITAFSRAAASTIVTADYLYGSMKRI